MTNRVSRHGAIISVVQSKDALAVNRASRVTEVGGIGQRFQPKEHPVLILG
jgi:hypothetical protein